MFQNREDIVSYLEKFFSDYIDEIILVDGQEEAFCGIALGFGDKACAIYDLHTVFNTLMSDGMSEEEAEEYFNFNMIGAYVGPNTPMYIRSVPFPHISTNNFIVSLN